MNNLGNLSLIMALVDFLPVIMFFISAVILQRDLYDTMSKGRFALLASGSILVLIGGIYKAAWKILYALGICDFTALDVAFFPMQAPGFLLVFLSLLGHKWRTSGLYAAVPLYTSNLIFIIAQVIGLGGTQFILMIKSLKMHKKNAAVMFVISFVAMLGMGYLGAKFDDSSAMNWLAQAVNIVSQLSFLIGVTIIHNQLKKI
ncbi:MAG: hypothetical protein K6A14_07130 [Erysipelotrichaceae bacterium]|nr:hypothetical protein [Erysipelotrichaceae bacterium]